MAQTFKIPQSVLVVIHTPALEVLLIRRADAPDFWQSVTGSKDALDESYSQTAVREVLEETGIDCAPGSDLADALHEAQSIIRSTLERQNPTHAPVLQAIISTARST